MPARSVLQADPGPLSLAELTLPGGLRALRSPWRRRALLTERGGRPRWGLEFLSPVRLGDRWGGISSPRGRGFPYLWEGVWSLGQAFSGLWAQIPCSGIYLSMSVLPLPGLDSGCDLRAPD